MKRLADQSFYEILEIPPDAASRDVETAVERARVMYGPGSLVTYSLLPAEEAALLGKRIEEARATLLDPDARARYDEALARAASARSGADAATRELPPVFAGLPPSPVAAPDAPPAAAAAPVQVAGPPVDVEVVDAPAVLAVAQPATLLAAAAQTAPAPGAPAAPILLSRTVAPASPPAAEASLAAPPAPTPVPMVSDGPWTGEVLRRLREARGLTLSQMAEKTKVTRHHLENLENDRFGVLPAPVYLRGILMTLARELRLDGQKVARSYLERMAQSSSGGSALPRPR